MNNKDRSQKAAGRTKNASNGDHFVFDHPANGLVNGFERTVAGAIIQRPPGFCYAAVRAVSDMIPRGCSFLLGDSLFPIVPICESQNRLLAEPCCNRFRVSAKG